MRLNRPPTRINCWLGQTLERDKGVGCWNEQAYYSLTADSPQVNCPFGPFSVQSALPLGTHWLEENHSVLPPHAAPVPPTQPSPFSC